MSTYKRKIYCLTLTFLFVLPVISFAQFEVNPTPSPGTGITYDCAVENPGRPAGECDFYDLVKATKHVINFATQFALAISVVWIAFAGSKYMMSGDNPGKRKEANAMLLNIVKGIVLILGAWLIVHLITSTLLKSGFSQFI